MIPFLKSIPFGALLAALVALFIGSGGGTGGVLNVHSIPVDLPEYGIHFRFWWSWMLFLGGTFLAFVFMLMMAD